MSERCKECDQLNCVCGVAEIQIEKDTVGKINFGLSNGIKKSTLSNLSEEDLSRLTFKNKSVPDAKSKTQVKRINVQQGRPAFYGLGWFTTDKPLPDGDYGWRWKKGSEVHVCTVVDGLIYGTDDSPGIFQCATCKQKRWIHTTLEPTIFTKGEWCKIEFPE